MFQFPIEFPTKSPVETSPFALQNEIIGANIGYAMGVITDKQVLYSHPFFRIIKGGLQTIVCEER